MMLQEMRVRLAVTAANANGPVEPPDTVNIVASLMTHSVPMVVVAARARFGPVSGSQRMSRPVVAKVPAAVAWRRPSRNSARIASRRRRGPRNRMARSAKYAASWASTSAPVSVTRRWPAMVAS
jgi:hypothetical protein